MNSHADVILELPERESETDRERERKKEREREIESEDFKILCHAGYESSLIFFTFQWFGDSIPNEFRGTFLQRESKHTEALIGRHPIGHL